MCDSGASKLIDFNRLLVLKPKLANSETTDGNKG